MKYLDEYRDPRLARHLTTEMARIRTRSWRLMEVCGGQTHTIVRHGLDRMLPSGVTLLHGPGCPVCITPVGIIDQAIDIARRPGVILCSFGDMLRVPGTGADLISARAEGADVRIVYSPLDAVKLARQRPDRQIVFFAVGFETTAPGTALAILQAVELRLSNFSVLVSHALVPPAIEALLASPENHIQAFLAAGHVCTVAGYAEYEPISVRYRVPIVVTGFEPVDILQGILLCLRQLESGRFTVENQYSRVVLREGNRVARERVGTVFQPVSREWRGLGEIPDSGFALRKSYADFDAAGRFGMSPRSLTPYLTRCQSGKVLQGRLRPIDCPEFGKSCTPRHPLGATMVSSEGACAAYFHYGRKVDSPLVTNGEVMAKQ